MVATVAPPRVKKIINSPESVVPDMIEGLALAHPNTLAIEAKYKVVTRKNPNKNKVALLSGGGSGHEPAHAGYVGEGMLDAAVCGDVFASPSTIQVYNGIKAVAGEKGALLIIKHYTGDRLNFEAAAEMAEEDDNIPVATVYVKDDVAVQDKSNRRGVAGTVFVHKIAGALAEEGADLQTVQAMAQRVADNVRSLGVAYAPCTVPAKGTPTFTLAENEVEMGIGIHGEAGLERLNEVVDAKVVAEQLTQPLVDELDLKSGDEIALLVNGMGGTPLQELYILNCDVRNYLDTKGVKVVNTLVGNYMTALEMAGASVTLLKVDAEMKRLLAAPANTPAIRV